MTWITDIKEHISRRYKIQPFIKENHKTRYKKFHNKATFAFVKENTNLLYHERHDHTSSMEVVRSVKTKLKNDVKFRFEWWFETLAYFNDIDNFLKSIPKKYLHNIVSLELMNPAEISAIKEHRDIYPVTMSVANKLPHNRYRYRIHVLTASTARRKIGQTNLLQIYNAISSYDGIQFTPSFSKSKTHMYIPAGSAYFYADTIDWIPMIILLEPTYIKKIELIKTKQEIENESAN